MFFYRLWIEEKTNEVTATEMNDDTFQKVVKYFYLMVLNWGKFEEYVEIRYSIFRIHNSKLFRLILYNYFKYKYLTHKCVPSRRKLHPLHMTTLSSMFVMISALEQADKFQADKFHKQDGERTGNEEELAEKPKVNPEEFLNIENRILGQSAPIQNIIKRMAPLMRQSPFVK